MRGILATFNCGKIKQPQALLEQFLGEIYLEDTEFLALGLQEVCPIMEASLNWQDIYLTPFKQAVARLFDEHFALREVAVVGSTALMIWTTYEPLNISIASISFGLGWSSLKGAIAIKLNDIVFVSAHLAAGDGRLYDRNRDCALVASQLHFPDGSGIYSGYSLFFFGDLNYRASEEGVDELEIERKQGRTLWGLDEAQIEFKPTYKLIPNSTAYNTKRIPSWCDRILYYNAYPLKYEAVFSYRNSDHRPVYLHADVTQHNVGELDVPKVKIDSVKAHPISTKLTDLLVGRCLWCVQTWRGRALVALLVLITWLIT